MTNLTDDDKAWTIRAINIHGLFFERWCSNVIGGLNGWKIISTNYPVEFPQPNGPIRGKESTLDIRAQFTGEISRITVTVECKKANPAFVNWIFFPRTTRPVDNRVFVRHLRNDPKEDDPAHWDCITSLLKAQNNLPICDDARETRVSYKDYKNEKGDKTKTSNAAVSEAAYQVTLASQALFLEEGVFSNTRGHASPVHDLEWRQQIILPVIVTTAKLYVCGFDPADIEPASGEIDPQKTNLTNVPFLFYEYPIPRHLQSTPKNLSEALRRDLKPWIRNHILVVHSTDLAGIFNGIGMGDYAWAR